MLLARCAFWRWSLGSWMIAGTTAGTAIGLFAPGLAPWLGWTVDLFLRFIRLLVAPLLVGILIPAIANAGHARNVARLGWRTLVIFEVATTIALLIGFLAAGLLQPGVGLALGEAPAEAPAAPPLREVLLAAVPISAVDAMARGDILQIVVVCLLFGTGALAVGEPARPVVALAESLAAITYRCVGYVMWLAPAAVCGALASIIATHGSETLQGLGRFLVAAWTAQIGVLLALALAIAASGAPLRRFVAAIREAFVLGFATSSSAAALPQALAGLGQFGVSPGVLGFVTPLSLTLHMSGSVAYLGVAVLFAAQASATPMTWSTLALLFLTLKIASKGVTGIPRAIVVILAATLDRFGMPAGAVTLLLGVDALIDPIRTAANVTSHGAAAVLVERWGGEREDAGRPERAPAA